MQSLKFKPEFIPLIRDGRKTQTRRLVKPARGKQSQWASVDSLTTCPSCYLCKVDGELGAQFQHPHAGTVQGGIEIPKNSPYGWFKSPYDVGNIALVTDELSIKITDVRVERLRDISEEDCLAEGCRGYADDKVTKYTPPHAHFKQVWDSIYNAGSWDENPWVWVYEFKVVK